MKKAADNVLARLGAKLWVKEVVKLVKVTTQQVSVESIDSKYCSDTLPRDQVERKYANCATITSE